MKKIWIGVEVYQLIVQEVHVFQEFEHAKAWFKEYTGVEWEGAESRREIGDNDYDQTKLFEVEVPVINLRRRADYRG